MHMIADSNDSNQNGGTFDIGRDVEAHTPPADMCSHMCKVTCHELGRAAVAVQMSTSIFGHGTQPSQVQLGSIRGDNDYMCLASLKYGATKPAGLNWDDIPDVGRLPSSSAVKISRLRILPPT